MEGISQNNIPSEQGRICRLLFHFEDIVQKEEGKELQEIIIEDEKTAFPSQNLVLDKIPVEFNYRYRKIPKSIYVRRCYLELYDLVSKMMLGDYEQPAFLFTGISGIGKSMFLIYFLCRYSMDDRFVDKRFAFEVRSGVYHYYVPSDSDVGQYICYHNVTTDLCPCLEILVVADIAAPEPPGNGAKWTLIFSSPNPLRYKEFMKGPNSSTFTLPTWSEEELCLVDRNMESWYDRFVKCGGIPRIVLWGGNFSDPMVNFMQDLECKGAIVAEYFFRNGFGNVDTEKSYHLVHINPPVLQDGSISYESIPVHTFASDFVFQKLKSTHTSALVADAANLFNAGGGLATEKLGAVSAGHLFEKICLWLVPLSGRKITPKALWSEGKVDDVPLGQITLPSTKILPYNWKKLKDLEEGFLYQPLISNLESGDAFCLLNHNGLHMLLVLQVTVGQSHPVKANGLKEIVLAFPEPKRLLIARKVIVFVTPSDGKINAVQALHSQNGTVLSASTVPHEVRDFEQWVYGHAIV